ncbi:hypothetical protein KJ966_15820 [bacterium]|nr:hypothetical protein [bacterium]
MRTDIFRMDLSIETISLFLCFEGLAYYDPRVSTQEILEVWQGSEQTYEKGLKELEGRNIIRKTGKKGSCNDIYKIVDHNEWIFRN